MPTLAPVSAPTSRRSPLNVLVVDDHAVVREGIRRLLGQEDDIAVIGEASSGEEAIALVSRRKPDLILMDARMPGMGGIRAIQQILGDSGRVRIIVFTAHGDEDLLWEALDLGAHGFILKDVDGAALIGALRQVAGGEPYVDQRLAPDFLRQLSRPKRAGVLSARERQILQLLADGCSNREVSERLVLSVETVKTHVKHILSKLDAEHRTQAVAIGIRQSLIE